MDAAADKIKVGLLSLGITLSSYGRIVYVIIDGAGDLVALDGATDKELWRIFKGNI